MIKVECAVEIYEKDGKEISPMIPGEQILVQSELIYNDRVRLVIDGKSYTVVAKDLQAAIGNCTNTARF